MKSIRKSQQLFDFSAWLRSPTSPVIRQLLQGNAGKRRISPVLIGQGRGLYTPVDSDTRIVPQDAALILRMVKVTALVKELGGLAQNQIAVREPGWHVHLAPILRRKYPALPLAEMRRAVSDINHHIKHLALNHTAKLGLRMLNLIVQSPQGVPDRSGVIVLNES